MAFFARPELENQQFKQSKGSNLALSGQTQIAETSGLTLSDGNNGKVVVTASGASSSTNGHVLTYDNIDKVIKLLPSSASGGTSFYNGASPTTITVGGLNSGENISNKSFTYILQKILVPDQPPTTSVSIANINREFGDTSTGVMNWNVTIGTNNIQKIELSTNGTGVYGSPILAGGNLNASTGGTAPYTIPAGVATPPQPNNSTSAIYRVRATTVSAETASSQVTINWRNKKFNFGDGTLYDNSNNHLLRSKMLGVGGVLTTNKSLNVTINFNNEFFYYAYPKSFGVPSFTVNGLPNNAWGSLQNNTLREFTYYNGYLYGVQYYVARSDNKITGSYTIVVS